MTLAEIIAKAESLYPSEYDKYELTQWVNEVEFMAVDKVLNRIAGDQTVYKPLDYDKDFERVLLIPDQFSGVYLTYISTKIDFNYRELDRYNLDSQLFEAEWKEYAYYMRRRYKPRKPGWYDKDQVVLHPEDLYHEIKKDIREVIEDVIGAEY